MSFPAAGTLMVEPTESEDLAGLDRFCDPMIATRAEIGQVAAGRWTVDSSPLRDAPLGARALVSEWDRDYTGEQAVYPAGTTYEESRPFVDRFRTRTRRAADTNRRKLR